MGFLNYHHLMQLLTINNLSSQCSYQYQPRSTWGTGPTLWTCSCLESLCRQRRYSYETPSKQGNRDVNNYTACCTVFTCCFVQNWVSFCLIKIQEHNGDTMNLWPSCKNCQNFKYNRVDIISSFLSFGWTTDGYGCLEKPQHIPSIHLKLLILLGVAESLEPISVSLGEGGETLNKSPAHGRADI